MHMRATCDDDDDDDDNMHTKAKVTRPLGWQPYPRPLPRGTSHCARDKSMWHRAKHCHIHVCLNGWLNDSTCALLRFVQRSMLVVSSNAPMAMLKFSSYSCAPLYEPFKFRILYFKAFAC